MGINISAELIGAPVMNSMRAGHIVKVRQAEDRCFVIGSTMAPVTHEFEILWSDGTTGEHPSPLVLPWIERAEASGLERADDIETRYVEALKARTERQNVARAADEERRKQEREFWMDAETRIPAGAKAVIIAEYHEDASDSMTDYFAHKTARVVILAFSTHTRDLFPELRKAALNHPDCAHLHGAPESAEHREKYSMGAGFYLKNGGRHWTGWSVRKIGLHHGPQSIPVGEWSLTNGQAAEAAPVTVSSLTIEKHTHTKKGFDMWIVVMPDRVDRAAFDLLLNMARDFGGWYSSKWGKTPGGFAFKDEAKAREFAQMAAGNRTECSEEADKAAAAKPATGSAAMADKFRELADAMQGEINHKFGPRQTNTPKRMREAGNARLEGQHLERTQTAMRALAALHEAGEVPAALASVRTKSAVHALTKSKVEWKGGYYDAGRCTGEPATDTEQARAIWALLKPKSEEEKRADALREKCEKLAFSNIPGFFPTPRAVIDEIFAHADLCDGLDVLEPEGGSGAILDAVRGAYPACRLTTYERHSSLREILALKGYDLAGSDFLEAEEAAHFDRVLMNPPFENGQDMEHVMKAARMLKDGGRLVAIMSPGPFYRSDKKAQAFREWFEAVGGEKYDLPANSFKESGTGTATVLIVLEV